MSEVVSKDTYTLMFEREVEKYGIHHRIGQVFLESGMMNQVDKRWSVTVNHDGGAW